MSDDAPAPKQDEPAEAASGSNGRPRLSTMKLRVIRALLAPVLVAGAVGVHFAVNVPEEKVVMKPRNKRKHKRPRRKPRAAVPERSAAQMDKAWKRWKDEPYEGEPIKGKWGRRMQTSVNKAVVIARKEAFKGAPEDPRVVVSKTQCRTVRCRFILRSPYEHEPGLVVEAMRRQLYGDGPLWRMVEAEPTEPPTEHSPQKDHYLQVTIGVQFDVIDTRDIRFEPAKKDAPAQKDAPSQPSGPSDG